MSKATQIPTRARQVVGERDQRRCVRCAGGAFPQLHHRRRRNVHRGDDEHAYCNLLTLCHVCHGWVHQHPAEARVGGFIVSAHEDDLASIPVRSFMGMITLACDGGIDWV